MSETIKIVKTMKNEKSFYFVGKILILETLAISKIIHLALVTTVPQEIVEEFI